MKPRLVTIAIVVASIALMSGCGAEPSSRPGITITSPAWTDHLVVGTSATITWETDETGTADIYLSRDGNATWELAATVNLADLSHSWTVTGPASEDCWFRVKLDGPYAYARTFSIVDPGVHLLAPEGGELWVAGESHDITWLPEAAAEAGIANVKIEVSRDGGAWEEIVASTDASTGVYAWTVDLGGGLNAQLECLFRVSDAIDGDPFDDSTGFTVLRTSGPVEWRVDSAAAPGGDGLTWATALLHPQDAVDLSIAGDELWVAGGTYVRRDAGDTVVLEMRSEVSVYGGFAGVEVARAARDWTLNTTTLDGEDAAQHVVMGIATGNVTFDGFTVRRGHATGSGAMGGGIYLWSCSNAIVANCAIEDNVADWGGGGIGSRCGSLVVVTSLISNNMAIAGGGLCHTDTSSVIVEKSWFHGNIAGAGGAIRSFSDASMTQVLFSSNAASDYGGVALCAGGDSVFLNCTFGDNTAGSRGDGLYINTDYSLVTLSNCIIWGSAPFDAIYETGLPSSTIATYCNVRGGFPGTGNINTDPLFVDTAAGDFHLQAASPCIDTADPATTLTEDIDGYPRPVGSGYDMGAYER